MGVRETNVVHEAQLETSKYGVVLWKNVRGVFRHLRSPAQIKVGVGPNGAGDMIGYRKVVITKDMVGQTIAQFLSVEAKTEDGVLRNDQKKFMDRVNADGGCAGIIRSAEDAVKLIKRPGL